VAESVALWSTIYELTLELPSATLAGVAYVGYMPLSSVYDKTLGTSAELSIN